MQKLSLICNKYLFWWVILLFVFIPLYPKFPFVNVRGTYVAIRLEDFVIAIATLFWFIAILPNIRNFLSQTLTKAFLLFWAIGALSLFSGIFLTYTVIPHLGLLHYLRRVEMMVLFFVAFSAFSNLRQVKLWLRVIFFVCLIIVSYGFGQQYLSFPVISTTNKEFSKGLILFLSPEARVNSTFAGHYDLAAFLAFLLSVLTVFLLKTKKIRNKAAFLIFGVLSFILLALTAARVSFFAAILGITLSLLLIGKKRLIFGLLCLTLLAFVISPELRHRTVATITVNFLGGGGVKYVPPPQMPGVTSKFSIENVASGVAIPSGVPIDIVPGEPLNTTELGVHRSFGIRLNEEWPRAIRAFEKNPMLGTGYSSITIATDNDYLRSLGEVGILGTLSLGLIFTIIIRKMYRFLRVSQYMPSRLLIIGVLSGLLTVFISSIFIDVLESSKIAELLWLTLGVSLAVIKIENNDS